MTDTQPVIRTYGPHDEKSLIELSDMYHGTAGGSVVRDSKYFRWYFHNNPDIERDGIMVASKEDRIVAYSVVAKDGRIMELCYDSNFGEGAIRPLLDHVMDYVDKIGADEIVLHAPVDDTRLREIMHEYNFSSRPRSSLTVVRCVDFTAFLNDILTQQAFQEKRRTESVRFRLLDPTSPVEEIVIRNGIAMKDQRAARLTIQGGRGYLLRVLLGGESYFASIIRGQISISPFWRIFDAREVFEVLQVKSNWFTPIADLG